MADGQIVFEVVTDGRPAEQSIRDITQTMERESRKWDDAAEDSSKKMGDSFAGALKKIAAGFSAAKIGQALLDIGKKAVEAASDLEEVQNVVNVTFGDNSNKIEKWAKTAGTQFGLTETQAKRFTSTLGAMMKSAGMSGDQIADMSTDLAGLAADMASFYNLDFDTAFQKIRSGISGETEPLKQLGINMSTANLEAFALQQGLEKTWNEMNQGEQIMLRYQYIMQATADAQGDFSNTSDGYANSLRLLQTNLTSLETNLGMLLIPAIAEATGFLNVFLQKLTGTQNQTVLDEFAAIDLKTEEKLASITKTAETARVLTQELDHINGTKINETGKKVQGLVDGLADIDLKQDKLSLVQSFIGTLSDNIDVVAEIQGTSSEEAGTWLQNIATAANDLDSNDVSGWESLLGLIKEGLPGFENTDFGTKFFESIESGYKRVDATAIRSFLETLSNNIGVVKTLLGTDAEGAEEWLTKIGNAADSLDPENAAGWEKLLNAIKEDLPGIENTKIGQDFFGQFGSGLSGVAATTNTLEWAIETLGNKTDRTEKEQALWLETCKRLVQTIPGLSSIINTETGEIKGGTEAVREYVKAWEDGQKKLTMQNALDAKQTALDQKFSELPSLELDKIVAQYRKSNALDALADFYQAHNLGAIEVDARNQKAAKVIRNTTGLTREEKKAYDDLVKAYEEAYVESAKATDEFSRQKIAYDIAKKALEDYEKVISEMPGEIENAVTETDLWLDSIGKTEDEIKNITNTASESLTVLTDYVKGVRDAVEESVNSVVNGFEKIDFTGSEAYGTVSKLTEELAGLEIGSEAYDAKVAEINKAKDSLVYLDDMYSALESQQAFMDSYMEYLSKAQQMGISDELLASLSDGSVESYQFLNALVNDTTGKHTAEEIDQMYQDVQKKKEDLTNALTEQQLTVDEVYQQMLEDAKEAVAGLDLEEEAKSNSEKTIQGLTDGITYHIDDVRGAVDSILAELDRLSGWGISIDWGMPVYSTSTGVGSTGMSGSSGNSTVYSNAKGLDYVPFDGYLSVLHEGEGILNAEENRIWRQFRDGGTGVDYEAMGGIMRDNIKPGGNVYLDGRVVGAVISDQQGRSYRQLQRSGWQG